MANDPKKPEENEELSAEELESVAGGAAYLKFDGIKGESTKTDHKDWIDVQSFSSPRSRKG